MVAESPAERLRIDRRHWGFVVLLAVEVIAASVLYKNIVLFDCSATAFAGTCLFISELPIRALSVFAALLIVAAVHPAAVRTLLSGGAQRRGTAWIALHVVGIALILLPAAVLDNQIAPLAFLSVLGMWVAGAVLAATGALLFLVTPAALRSAVDQAGRGALAVLPIAALMPEIAKLAQQAWLLEPVSSATLNAAAGLLRMTGTEVLLDPDQPIVTVGDFSVIVSWQCSGIEGIALISAFFTLHWLMFRDQLRALPYWMLLPVGIALSWLLNVVRIAVLILIGANVSPELAVNGFHSHAGWLMFSVLALALVAVSRSVPAIRKAPPDAFAAAPALPPFFRDPVVAELLPFFVFMFSGLLASTFSAEPGTLYPLRAAMMAVAVLLFLPVYRALPWRLDPVSVAAGAAIGVLWVVTAAAPEGPPPSGTLAGLPLVLWIAARGIGTILLVPLIEEMVFRGYILRRLAPGGRGVAMMLAIGVSAGLFALLHDRWIEAGLAGIVFGLLVWRSGKVTDAVVSHAVANALVFAAALLAGNFAMI